VGFGTRGRTKAGPGHRGRRGAARGFGSEESGRESLWVGVAAAQPRPQAEARRVGSGGTGKGAVPCCRHPPSNRFCLLSCCASRWAAIARCSSSFTRASTSAAVGRPSACCDCCGAIAAARGAGRPGPAAQLLRLRRQGAGCCCALTQRGLRAISGLLGSITKAERAERRVRWNCRAWGARGWRCGGLGIKLRMGECAGFCQSGQERQWAACGAAHPGHARPRCTLSRLRDAASQAPGRLKVGSGAFLDVWASRVALDAPRAPRGRLTGGAQRTACAP
jgi:hypothetical protein